MTSRILFVLFTSLPSLLLADQVVMKNGDRLTGVIQSSDAKALILKPDYADAVTLPWDAIASVKSDHPLHVALKDGKTIQGTVQAEGAKVEVASPTAKQEVPAAEVTALRNDAAQAAFDRLQHPGWLQLWTGSLNLGFAGTAGNSRTSTFTTGATAIRVTRTDKTSIYFSEVKSSATVNGKNSDTANAVRGGWAYSHNLAPRLFVSAFNDWEYDRFQNLDLRYVFGGGGGYSAIKNDRSRLDLVAGADYSHARFDKPAPTAADPNATIPLVRSSAEVFWGDDYSLKVSKLTSITQSFRMFNDLSQTGQYRMNFDAGAVTILKKWLTWNVTLSDRFLSDPVPGLKKNDFLYSTGLGFTFAH